MGQRFVLTWQLAGQALSRLQACHQWKPEADRQQHALLQSLQLRPQLQGLVQGPDQVCDQALQLLLPTGCIHPLSEKAPHKLLTRFTIADNIEAYRIGQTCWRSLCGTTDEPFQGCLLAHTETWQLQAMAKPYELALGVLEIS